MRGISNTPSSRETCDASTIQSQRRQVDGRFFNDVGVELLTDTLHAQLFPKRQPELNHAGLRRIHEELQQANLSGEPSDSLKPVDFQLPPLLGKSLDAHFRRMTNEILYAYYELIAKFARAKLPDFPKTWLVQDGWTRYPHNGAPPTSVPYPDEQCLVFDVETLVREGQYPVMAVAASRDAWYAWISPRVMQHIEYLAREEKSDVAVKDKTDTATTDKTKTSQKERQWDYTPEQHLIPMMDDKEQLVIGHFVSYDRARILNEYTIEVNKRIFLDTASLHVAVSGHSSQQQPQLRKASNEFEQRMAESSPGLDVNQLVEQIESAVGDKLFMVTSNLSLRDAARLHLKEIIDKDTRETFVTGTIDDIVRDIQSLLHYNASDVAVTHRLYRALCWRFLRDCPHPVSLAGPLLMSKCFLPVNGGWNKFYDRAESIFKVMNEQVESNLRQLVEEALAEGMDPTNEKSFWLKQLDWTILPARMTKETEKSPAKPYKRQRHHIGLPEWYRELFSSASAPMSISLRTRISPILLKLRWKGYPLYYSVNNGWAFRVPAAEAETKSGHFTELECEFPHQRNPESSLYERIPAQDPDGVYFRIPHPDGAAYKCGRPIAKGYQSSFDSGVLSSEYPLAAQALECNNKCSYWLSARSRIQKQFVVWLDSERNRPISDEQAAKASTTEQIGMIVPMMLTMGTVTRRAVEPTWLTASNSKKQRIGSELKSYVVAPPGYRIVGADVDSEELWIASLVGDAQLECHGGTAFGWMTLQGSKKHGTDLHSKTAEILGISRDQAKVFNYARIYGATERYATQLIKQYNPTLTDDGCKTKAAELYASTKGELEKYGKAGTRWSGGTESTMFNMLEKIAMGDNARTPVLHARITHALRPDVTENRHMTSRLNWVVQSSGVDYLHLLLVAVHYLARKFDIKMRFMISIHDEVRYLVKEEDTMRAALALQIANIWTRAMFCEKLEMTDVPLSVAFFSACDIDHVLRKEVDMDCVTPSQLAPIPSGKSVDIHDILAATGGKLEK